MDPVDRARRYYDAFAATYEVGRDGRSRYHDLLDDLEVDLCAPLVRGRSVLEVGCGTGLLLRRLAPLADEAVGVDLSPGMLARARERGLTVVEGDARALPFPDARFDVAVSFKTLPHVPDLAQALAELARVVRPGGFVVAEVYNPTSLRALVKRVFPAGKVGSGTERDVFVRFDDAHDFRAAMPPRTRLVQTRGIRTLVPMALALEVPVLGGWLEVAERQVADGWIGAHFGGFVARVLAVDPSPRGAGGGPPPRVR